MEHKIIQQYLNEILEKLEGSVLDVLENDTSESADGPMEGILDYQVVKLRNRAFDEGKALAVNRLEKEMERRGL